MSDDIVLPVIAMNLHYSAESVQRYARRAATADRERRARPAAEAEVLRPDARRLLWVSKHLGTRNRDYGLYVLQRGGDGDLSDIRTYIDDQIAARSGKGE